MSDAAIVPGARTIVIDDDPTGTQSARGVIALLDVREEPLVAALTSNLCVYVQTNTRAVDEAEAIAIVERVHRWGTQFADRFGESVRFVLRGDSTLRGHVFAEIDVLAGTDSRIVFAPAFPQGGRTTVDGVHYVRIEGRDVPADQTEYAGDPVFPFDTAVLVDYVKKKSGRSAISVSLEQVRSGRLAESIRSAPPGAVVVPDIESDGDVALVAAAIDELAAAGDDVVVRGAAPLAAAIAGASSNGLLSSDQVQSAIGSPSTVLLACGSHTAGATEQLASVTHIWAAPAEIDTDSALRDPAAAAADAVARARTARRGGLIAVATERHRREEHDTLQDGGRIMEALVAAVRFAAADADVVVAKGGITSSEIARLALGASTAFVAGQLVAGVSLWILDRPGGQPLPYVVVPGNVGDAGTIVRVLELVGTPKEPR